MPSSLSTCYLPVFYHGECSMAEIDPCTIIILARQRFSSSQSGSIRSILLSARHPGLTCIFSILNARSVKYFVGKWAKMGRLSGLMVVCRDTGTNFPFKLSFSRGPWGHGKNLTLCPYILRDLNVLRSSSYTFPFLSWRWMYLDCCTPHAWPPSHPFSTQSLEWLQYSELEDHFRDY